MYLGILQNRKATITFIHLWILQKSHKCSRENQSHSLCTQGLLHEMRPIPGTVKGAKNLGLGIYYYYYHYNIIIIDMVVKWLLMTCWIIHITEHLKTLITEVSCRRSKLTQRLLTNVLGIRDGQILPKYDTHTTSLSPAFRNLPRRENKKKLKSHN